MPATSSHMPQSERPWRRVDEVDEEEDVAYLAPFAVEPTDRVGPPLKKRRRSILIRLALLASAAGTGAWAWAEPEAFQATWQKARDHALTLSAAVMESARGPAPTAVTPPPVPPAPAPSLDAMPAKQSEPPTAVEPPQTAETAAPPSTPAPEAAQPQESAVVEDEDAPPPGAMEPAPVVLSPQQKRALAVGLHPDLSSALLERMSAADYENAGKAIRQALADGRVDAVHIYPKDGKVGLARFEVKFVAGAASGCRRYVVTIAKAGWSTTALPVEKCGNKRQASAG